MFPGRAPSISYGFLINYAPNDRYQLLAINIALLNYTELGGERAEGVEGTRGLIVLVFWPCLEISLNEHPFPCAYVHAFVLVT